MTSEDYHRHYDALTWLKHLPNNSPPQIGVPEAVGIGGLEFLAEEAIEGIAEGGIRFGQQGVSAMFRHGEFAGRTIDEVVAGLRSGAISADQVPLQTITREGVVYTLNNRSLMALRQAGIEPTVIQDVTGDAFFEQQLTQRLKEMGGAVPQDFVPVIRKR